MKGICEHCGYTVKVCVICQGIMPPATHGTMKYCGQCRRLKSAEYNRQAQAERRSTLREHQDRLESLEQQLA